jgi:hypothetical protein
MPGRHDIKYRQRGPELTEITPTQGMTHQSRAAPPIKMPGSETVQQAKPRWRYDDESDCQEAGHSKLRWHVRPAALQTYQVTVRNPGEASASPGATENTRRNASEHSNPAALGSAALPVGSERDVSACVADDVVCGCFKWPRSGTQQFATPHQTGGAAITSGRSPELGTLTKRPPLRTTQTTSCQVAIIKEKPDVTVNPSMEKYGTA